MYILWIVNFVDVKFVEVVLRMFFIIFKVIVKWGFSGVRLVFNWKREIDKGDKWFVDYRIRSFWENWWRFWIFFVKMVVLFFLGVGED